MLNENLIAVKQSNPGQLKLPSRAMRNSPKIISTISLTPANISTSILKLQQQQKQKTRQVQSQKRVRKQQYGGAKRLKILDCSTQVKYVYNKIIKF